MLRWHAEQRGAASQSWPVQLCCSNSGSERLLPRLAPPARCCCAAQVKLAQDIINRNQKGLPVHRVPDAPVANAALEDPEEWEAARGGGAQRQRARQEGAAEADGAD